MCHRSSCGNESATRACRMRANTVPARTIICYHYPCPDGVFAALAAFLYHRTAMVDHGIHFVPLTTWDKPAVADLNLEGDETVYFLDYTGPKGFARSVTTSCKEVIVLDHHKTAQEDLAGPEALPPNMHAHLDMNKSGATIAQAYFDVSVEPAIDQCFRFIEDGDLWRWRLPGAKAFYAGLKARNIEYDANKNPGVFEQLLQLQPDVLIAEGEPILVEEESMLQKLVDSSFRVRLGGPAHAWGTALAVRTDDAAAIKARSELGNRLAVASRDAGLAPVGVIAYDQEVVPGRTELKVSLRSCDGFDTTRITAAQGGGGHAAASSCMMTDDVFQSWRCNLSPA
eukprot:jgi/Ulvmu1/415/UM001_0422.1